LEVGFQAIRGIVSGKMVYLVFLYDDRVYYTARLELFQGSLNGNYFKANDKEQIKGYATSLARIVEPAKQ
jgi:hypothetical protein